LGYCGIGTSSPQGPLHISGINANTFFYNTFSNAANRNWGLIFGVGSLGDFNIMSSNAEGGNPSTAGTSRLNIQSNGNVGIGTSSPSYMLDILSTQSYGLRVYQNINSDNYVRIDNTSTGTSATSRVDIGVNANSYALTIQKFGLNYSGSLFGISVTNSSAIYDNSASSNGLFIGAVTSTPIIFGTSNTERMRIFASGNVRFSSQVYNNTVASPRTLYIASDGELGGISSIRASKTNIEQLDSNWLMQLNPVSFNYRKKDEYGKYTDEYYDELFYGLIAEETELVNKEICTYNDDKLVGIEYSKLVPVLVKAIQELKAEIEELKELIKNK
jgi:hypothetical protein